MNNLSSHRVAGVHESIEAVWAGVVSGTAVSLTYCIQARAIASLGNQAAFRGFPTNLAAATDSLGKVFAEAEPAALVPLPT